MNLISIELIILLKFKSFLEQLYEWPNMDDSLLNVKPLCKPQYDGYEKDILNNNRFIKPCFTKSILFWFNII